MEEPRINEKKSIRYPKADLFIFNQPKHREKFTFNQIIIIIHSYIRTRFDLSYRILPVKMHTKMHVKMGRNTWKLKCFYGSLERAQKSLRTPILLLKLWLHLLSTITRLADLQLDYRRKILTDANCQSAQKKARLSNFSRPRLKYLRCHTFDKPTIGQSASWVSYPCLEVFGTQSIRGRPHNLTQSRCGSMILI